MAHRDDGVVGTRRQERGDKVGHAPAHLTQALPVGRGEVGIASPPDDDVLGQLQKPVLVPVAVVELDQPSVTLHRARACRRDRIGGFDRPPQRARQHPRPRLQLAGEHRGERGALFPPALVQRRVRPSEQ